MATEKRLIDANAVLETLADIIRELPVPIEHYMDGLLDGLDRAFEILEYAPTVDAVEVVRCKDCKHWCYEYDNVGLCTTDVPDIDGVQRLASDFCSYGERKDNA